MIDEKKIEEAADAYLLEKLKDNIIGDSDFKDIPNAFKAGINWFLDNLWHDASEEPKEGKQLVLSFPNGNCYACYRSGKYYKTPNISVDKYDVINTRDITRWLYVEDLLKGGTNG